jgi:hypothetical protein
MISRCTIRAAERTHEPEEGALELVARNVHDIAIVALASETV